MKTILLIVVSALLLTSCNEYQKVLRTNDIALKYAFADSLYKRKKFKKALVLMEQIVPVYRGKPQAEPLMFRYANSFYNLGDYYLSGYQFERFEKSYPKSDSLEIASYRAAKSYYELSPRYSLDQKDTHTALEKLQNFINKYPDSDYRVEANTLVQGLRKKLEKKDYEVAKQYLRISDYKASIAAYSNFITDHPGSDHRENAFFERVEAAYKLAINSVPSKVEERLQATKRYYDSFVKYYGESPLKEEADEILQDVEKRLSQKETAIN